MLSVVACVMSSVSSFDALERDLRRQPRSSHDRPKKRNG